MMPWLRAVNMQTTLVLKLLHCTVLLAAKMRAKPKGEPKHLHNIETSFCCPQAFLSLDFQCMDDASTKILNYTFWD